jgi:hypothetical protein
MIPTDRERFIQAADAFLLVCRDDAAKQQAGERLLNVLADLWTTNDARAYRYRGFLFFAQPGDGGEWRLAVYPEKLIEQVK